MQIWGKKLLAWKSYQGKLSNKQGSMGFPDSFKILTYVYYLLNYLRPYQGLQKLTRLTGISWCIASKNWAVSCMSWRCRNWVTSSRHCWDPLQKYSNWLGAGSQSFSRRCWCRWCTVSSSMSAFSSFDNVSSSYRNKLTDCDCVYAAAPHCMSPTNCTSCIISTFSCSRHLLMRALRLRSSKGFMTLRYW